MFPNFMRDVSETAEEEIDIGLKNNDPYEKRWRPNISPKTLVDPKKIFLPPLHIKLELIKQFVYVLPNGSFKYLCRRFSHLSEAKLNQRIFVTSDIRKLMFDSDFEVTMMNKGKGSLVMI